MPVMMKVSRSVVSSLRFCQLVSSAKTTWNSRGLLFVAAKCGLSQSNFRTVPCSKAIELPDICGHSDHALGISSKAKNSGRAYGWRSSLAFLCVALFLGMSLGVASAQTATTTTLTVAPLNPPNTTTTGSVFVLTATVKAGTAMGGGTVTFRDTFGGATETLGTVQVESGNGTSTKGNAVLRQQLGGIGTHPIAATYNVPNKTYSPSSATASVTVGGLYPTTASLTSTGVAGNYSLTTKIVGTGSPNLSPTGSVSILDTSNSNYLLGTATPLSAGTFGQQTIAGSTSPVAVGNGP